ncbi:FecR family protein [Algoriphagus aquimarinus]|uniref:DUF4974 domain-containing protein n=1 Tax=Algoriphagus aquimarinus TaxID=237018 RepID=A0A5C7ARI0_9BACT|nr:FecR domain-containing protein [Algoriphagus aquimarinus]TXE11260.1 DUF4974 domain-containing protein [Algoriphagus aquimarinus]
MTEESSNLFQNDNAEFEEIFETDIVGQMNKEDQQALKKKILGNIKTGIQKHEKKRSNRRRILSYTKIAASILVILAINGALWTTLKLEKHTYQTGSNETLKIELPDGSTALLNSNSSLSYTYNLAFGFERKVELIGEAYFEIAKDAESKRFVINEGDVMEVEVFGTEFNLKNQHPIHKLTLIEGSVKLGYQSEQGNTNRMVVPGETIKLNVENHQLEAKTVADPIKLLAWQDRKLRMQNESLEEVLSIVTELYDLELVDQTPPTNYHLISGSLPLTDNPNEVIENIEVLFDTKIHLEQNPIRVQ